MKFWNKIIKTHAIAVVLIAVSCALAIGSMWKDSSIRDEMPHIVGGYSYLTKLDYRVNPEHPPLIKEISAIPLLFMDVYFPDEDVSWKNKVNDQWSLGDKFLYKYGNDADQMLFWGRVPMVLIFLIGGWVLYRWAERMTRRREIALVALILYLFSPNLMAHGRFITTDMGMTIFSLFAFYAYYLYLEKPDWKKLIGVGLVFGFAQLAKFSVVMVIPAFFVVAFLYGLGSYKKGKLKNTLKEICLQLSRVTLIMIIGYLLVGAWYYVHMAGMPKDVQHRLIDDSIASYEVAGFDFRDMLHTFTEAPVLRPYSQYLLGFFMVTAHTAYGHTTYFFGEVGKNWPEYFTFAYLMKEPLPAQFLFFFGVLVLLVELARRVALVKKDKGKNLEKGAGWLRSHAVMLGYFFLVLVVFIMSSLNKLQLGIRYIIPIFPFIYLFTAYMIWVFWEDVKDKKRIALYYFNIGALVVVMIWYIGISFVAFPSYLAYFNEVKGGPKEAWKYFVDSNLDWGQDLVRLEEFMDENSIEHIRMDYFGGGNLDYYLGDRYEYWGFDKGYSPGWFAISASAIQWNSQNDYDKSYHWLTDNYEPVEQIGYSIFVYYVPEEN